LLSGKQKKSLSSTGAVCRMTTTLQHRYSRKSEKLV